MSLRELNEKLKQKYGSDLSAVSPLSPKLPQRQYSELGINNPGLPASKTMEKSLIVLRKGELVDFYSFHDPSREDIETHVDNLFDKYSFEALKAALQSKYSAMPSGW